MVADATDHGSSLNTLEARHQHASHSRRVRPADLAITTTTSDENRIPSRAEKLTRREPKLGLRNIFGRPKTGNDEDVVGGAREGSGRSTGIRASLVSNWPYGLHGHRSEMSLPFLSPSSQTVMGSFSPPGNDNHLKHKKSASAAVKDPSSPRSAQRAAWDSPPLFQAYSQAIRHCSLPACTLPTEAILRFQGQRDGTNEEIPGDKATKSRRGHRRKKSGSSFKTGWTTKIFILVTSGYLLQYAGEGSFDRLPERMLHLGKDSAAFASDVIPGRHWVLQVSSVTDVEGPAPSPSTSLFSRLPFRGALLERRQASNFLMIFESAEAMESWIVILRREIEALGGKKSLSETGKPRADDESARLKTQTSQRTLVVRESSRFSQVLSQELPWDQAAAMANSHLNFRFSSTDSDAGRDQSFDGTSTASVISHDGRRLDGLRDSTQRLSYVSSGQRTMITSPGSSPASSPMRDSFGSQLGTHFEDLSLDEQEQWQEKSQQTPGLIMRPNASAILDRRQSMQMANHLAEMRVAQVFHRPFSTAYTSSLWQTQPPSSGPELYGSSPPQNIVPNFSVPHIAAGKRYSVTVQSAQETSLHQITGPPRPHRRPPPSAISINPRPLSLVVDHPSPNPSTPASVDRQLAFPGESLSLEDVQIDTYELQEDEMVALSGPHKYNTSITTIQESLTTIDQQPWVTWSDSVTTAQRPKSSLDNRRPSTASSLLSSSAPGSEYFKRFSLHTTPSHTAGRLSTIDSEASVTITSMTAQDSSIRAHNPTLFKSSPCHQRLSVCSTSKSVMGRRSLGILAEIPPPAPPPTCALPPLPVPRDI